ncbi:MAG: selenide, water dikinase SelD [Reinekea sp.]
MIERDLVFVGGGHTHALVLRMLAMQPPKGVRLTLITDTLLTPYSGMLPGYIAGHYTLEDTHIDLNRLCQHFGIRLINDRVTGLDPANKTIQMAQHRDLVYDWLSINTGSTPNLTVPGAREFALGVKPVSQLTVAWQHLLDQKDQADSHTPHWAIVGAGAAGVEIAFAIAHRFKTLNRPIRLTLVLSGEQILSSYSDSLRAKVMQRLAAINIKVLNYFRVREVTKNSLLSDDNRELSIDKSLWCTPAVAPNWPGAAGLATDTNGFISVNQFLQSQSHSNIFACGDVAHISNNPRPKAGVYAVRSAPFLLQNLGAVIDNKAMKRVRLQRDFLSLMSLGGQYAVGQRNGVSIAGRWVWHWKDRIDRKFMAKFDTDLPEMKNVMAEDMHCAGCGSKLGPELLSETLQALNPGESVFAEDAAQALVHDEQLHNGQSLWQSIDGFRAMTEDYYQLGKIVTHHAINDCYAMGLRPNTAQTWVNLAFSHPRIARRDFKWLMSGIYDALAEHECRLIGGHSTEGAETHLALVVNALGEARWPKRSAHEGDWLMLNRPIGTGILLAANMAGRAKPLAIEALWQSLLNSNKTFFNHLESMTVHAATDITGFGLIGHLLEMFADTGLGAVINADDVPLLDDALRLSSLGVASTLLPQLQPLLQRCDIRHRNQALIDCLLDPQTQGGLLVSVPAEVGQTLQQHQLALTIGKVFRQQQPVILQ